MAVTLGGSNGVTYPDASNTPASYVTSRFAPAITDTTNVMTLRGGVKVIGSSGVLANGTLATTSVTVNITISTNTANYVLNTAKATGYVAGGTVVNLTINSGVIVYSASTGSYALTVDTSWAAGDTINITNNGTILGRGGNGGNGASGSPVFAGTSGGPALLVQRAAAINNVNRIAGGGGGGGGGAYASQTVGKTQYVASGGGGAGGIGGSTGGSNGGGSGGSTAGTGGTLTSAGTNGNGGNDSGQAFGGAGGFGGSYGSDGTQGGQGNPSLIFGGLGGAAGAAVVGNSYITWVATGTRNGSIS